MNLHYRVKFRNAHLQNFAPNPTTIFPLMFFRAREEDGIVMGHGKVLFGQRAQKTTRKEVLSKFWLSASLSKEIVNNNV